MYTVLVAAPQGVPKRQSFSGRNQVTGRRRSRGDASPASRPPPPRTPLTNFDAKVSEAGYEDGTSVVVLADLYQAQGGAIMRRAPLSPGGSAQLVVESPPHQADEGRCEAPAQDSRRRGVGGHLAAGFAGRLERERNIVINLGRGVLG